MSSFLLALVIGLLMYFPPLIHAQQPDPAITQTEQQQAQTIKPGSKEDIHSIGTRNVGGGTGLGNWYSLEKEIRLGQAYAFEIESTVTLVTNPIITEYVNQIGQKLVRNSDSQVPFKIRVIDSDEINAFALPGGFLFVNTGLIRAAESEAELAGIMAHEIAHVAARHATRQLTRGHIVRFAALPLIFLGGLGYTVTAAVSVGIPVGFLKFSRQFEMEADMLGLEYLYAAGYDPQAYISFFERMLARQTQPGAFAKLFSTHPRTPDRVHKAQEIISTILPPRDQYIADTSEFAEVRARLNVVDSHRLSSPGPRGQRPTLRRRTNGGDVESTNGTGAPDTQNTQ